MRRLLALNFFPAFTPPRSGGEQRYFYLYRELSRWFDVTLLSPTYPDHAPSVEEFSPTYREHRIPKSAIHQGLHAILDAERIGSEVSGLVCALASTGHRTLQERFDTLAPQADLVLHDSPFLVRIDRSLARDDCPRVYNSYNVEADLADQVFTGPAAARYRELIAQLERQLIEGSARVFATSEPEQIRFQQRYGCPADKIRVVPNGFDDRAAAARLTRAEACAALGLDAARPVVVFIGSSHPPNIEAAAYIATQLAPSDPAVQFLIAGTAGDALPHAAANVHRLGRISDMDRLRLFAACDVALNAVIEGGGTNLKMLDYLAAGLPVLSTPFGARGLGLRTHEHAILAERGQFVPALRELLRDAAARARLGENGRRLAHERFTWSAIATATRGYLDELLDDRARRRGCRHLVLLNDFSVATPTHGGQTRIRELFTRLAKRHDVTLLCLTDESTESRRRVSDHFIEIRVPKTAAHRRAEREAPSAGGISMNDIVAARLCTSNAELMRAYRRLVSGADAVILEHPYMAPLLEVQAPNVPVIYEALNVEARIKAQLFEQHPDRRQLLAEVRAVEAAAVARASHVVCVCEDDAGYFAGNGRSVPTTVIGNGVTIAGEGPPPDAEAVRGLFGSRSVAIFVGSGHPPNVEALAFVIQQLAPRHPAAYFVAVGSCCDAFRHAAVPANVLLCGVVTDAQRRVLLSLANVALNPMRSGGGSSLKVAEYLAAGTAVLSTPVGIRGYGLRAGTEVVVAELEEFSSQLHGLLETPPRRRELARAGRQFAARHLDWARLADGYAALLDELLAARPVRLLATTFRFTDPPRGGAETYLFELLRRLHASGRYRIDVATFQVGNIESVEHFAVQYGSAPAAAPPFVEHVHSFAVAAPPRTALVAHCRRLFDVWQAEDLVQARRFVDRYRGTLLLGGWYPPEVSIAGTRRWAGPVSEIFCAAGTTAVILEGWVPRPSQITIAVGDRPPETRRVRRRFAWRVPLGKDVPAILQIRAAADFRRAGDARGLGVCITQLLVEAGASAQPLSLEADFAAFLRADDLHAWVDSLIEMTQSRERQDDQLFIEARGPQSPDFTRWLEAHVGEYDVALAHGLPFSPAIETVDTAHRAGTPAVLLPHLHFDDKYYHWRAYYDAFKRARLVLAAPAESVPLLYDHIGATAAAVPGGAVEPAEFGDLNHAIAEFNRCHRSPRPFVLCLGRKSGAKHYASVIRAVEAVNRNGGACDLVMLGPDDDRVRLTSACVAYYGVQSRAVVLGALARCAALVNMSDSESFGIVVVEAWMCRKPALVNRHCPALRALVEHERDGLLCSDAAELAAAIERVLADPEFARTLGEHGYRKALREYTWDRVRDAVSAALVEATHATPDIRRPGSADADLWLQPC